jgi:hypothetical protein
MSAPHLPPDIAAYLQQATETLAQESGITQETHTPEQFSAWVEENLPTIIDNASSLMRGTAVVMIADTPNQAVKSLKRIMAIRVWEAINVSETRRQCRAAEYAALSSADH